MFGSPLTMLLGVDLIYCWAGESELVIPVRNDLKQAHGTVHGGVLGVAADNACGWAAASALGPLVTASYLINFLSPAKGELVRARAKIVKAARRSAVVSAEVFVENGGSRELVAVATASVALIGPRS